LISRERLHQANQRALKRYRAIYWWDSYVYGKTEYIHDFTGKEKILPINYKIFGHYRNTSPRSCRCSCCRRERDCRKPTRQELKADISFREQLRESGVIQVNI